MTTIEQSLATAARHHRAGRLADAEQAYRSVLRVDPSHAPAHNNLGVVLREQLKLDEAADSLEQAVRLQPDYATALGNLATVYEKLHRLDDAEAAAARALEVAPDDVQATLAAAACQRRRGRHAEAIGRLEKLLCSVAPGPDLARRIAFQLGSLYDRIGNAAHAFAYFSHGNRLASESWVDWTTARDEYLQGIDRLQETFNEAWVGTWTGLLTNQVGQASSLPNEKAGKMPAPLPSHMNNPGWTPGPGTPVFLVGFPRSGTTLLDQILDSHPKLQTLEERPAVEALRREIDNLPGGYPAAIADLSAAELDRLRATYFRTVDQYIKRQPGQILVDKFSLNLVETGLILRVFPRARFIVAVRHPCDVCLSGFMQNFHVNPAMASFFTLEDAATLYAKVMDLWRQYVRVLPHPYHAIRYEDLVGDFRGETGRLLEFLGIEWDEAVCRFAEHARRRGGIKTPSYYQVTEPIHGRARYRWRRYAEQLAPVMDVLGPYIEHFGYSESTSDR